MPVALPLVHGTLADPSCWPATPQALYEEMFDKGSATMPDVAGILVQDAAPDPVDRGVKGWIPTSGNVPIYPGGGVFWWHPVVGHWVCRHNLDPADGSLRLYFGTAASVTTYEHGDANPLGIASGPFWAIKSTLAGRAPVGVGLIPTSNPAATITNPLDTADTLGNSGEYKHSLTPDEMQHMHGCGENPVNLVGGNADDPAVQLHRDWNTLPETYTTGRNDMSGTGGTGYVDAAAIGTGAFATTKAVTDPDFPTVDGHLNMQPFFGIYFLERTIRQFWIAG